MPHDISFLADEDVPLFDAPGRRVARALRKVSEIETSKPEPLITAVLERLRSIPNLAEGRFRCCCITVEADDGMSWSAEDVARRCAKEVPQYKLWRVQDAPERSKLPAIAEIIGEKRFVNAAAKRKFTTKFLSVSSQPWMSPLIAALLFVIPALIEALKQIKPGQPLTTTTFSEPLIWIYGSIMSALGLAGKWAAEKHQSGTKSKSVKELRQRLDDERGTPEYDAFVRELVNRLSEGDFPRIVIIDNWQALDHTSRAVFEGYLQSDSRDDAEFWVVFEKETRQLAVWLADRSGAGSRSSHVFSYDQLPLTTQQKRDLVKLTHGKEEAIESTSVKFVCQDWTKKIQSLNAFFEQWRGRHPAQPNAYGDLELLYLLSLTAAPGDFYLRPATLSSRLHSLRPAIAGRALLRFLNNVYPDAEEVESRCDGLTRQMPEVVKSGEGAESLRVRPEAAAALAQTADSLTLPPPALGHLFWCLFWESVWRAGEMEPFWMRKIILHLIEAKAGALQNENDIKTARQELLRINLFAIDKALPTCLFSYELPLFKRVLRLLRDSPLAIADRQQAIQKAWECFAFFGDSLPEPDWTESRRKREDGLAAIIGELSGELTPLSAKDPDRRGMLRLFLDSIPASALHEQEAECCFSFLSSASGASASDYAICRAAWLTLTLVPLAWGHAETDFDHLRERSVILLEQLFAPLLVRLNGKQAATSRGADLVTLSMALWCEGLALSFDPLGPPTNEQKEERLIRLARHAGEAIAVAREIRQTGSRLVSGEDLFSRSIAREVCAVALASIVTASHYIKTNGWQVFTMAAIEEIAGVFSSAAATLVAPLPEIRSESDLLSVDLARQVSALMRLSILVWRQFGLSQLHDLLSLRHVYFATVSTELSLDTGAAIRGLMESMSAAGEREDFIGLMANCVLAGCLKAEGDLSAQLLCRAGAIAMSSQFGEWLQQFLALVIVEQANAFDIDLRPFVELLIRPRPDGSRFLADYLRESPPPDMCNFALRFFNTCQRTGDKQIRTEIERIFLETAQSLPEGEPREEFEALIDWVHLKAEIRDGVRIDPDECIARWAPRKRFWVYGAMLDSLLLAGNITSVVRIEAVEQLKGHIGYAGYNTYYLLALDLLDYSDELEPASQVALDFVKESLPKWEPVSKAETNTNAYRRLLRYDTANRATYLRGLAKWQAVLYEREHLQRLRGLYEQGQHFLLFKQYFLWMEDWGLRTELEPAAFRKKWNLGSGEKKLLVENWASAGGSTPNPFITLGNDRVIFSDFLLIGSALFELPFDESASDRYAEARKRFNETAAASRRELLQLFNTLPYVPAATAQLLSAHSERLYRFSEPANLRTNPAWSAA